MINNFSSHYSSKAEFSNNNLIISRHGQETAAWKFRFLKEAQQSIEFSPNYAGERTFTACLLEIQSGMESKQGLKVHIIVSKAFLENEHFSLMSQLKNSY